MVARVAHVAMELLGELVAPLRCAACDEMVRARAIFCAACGVSVMRAEDQPSNQLAVFSYGGAVAAAIVRLKYAGRFDLAARFEGVMALTARGVAGDVDMVVPVPLHPRRLAERGYDQAALLAGPVARELGVRHAPRGLSRKRETPPQASLDREERVANVAEAFVASAPAKIAGRRVLLVDDVRTTGATLAACDEALRKAGAKRVMTLVLASRDRDENVKKTPKYED
jgi:ComF family protein